MSFSNNFASCELRSARFKALGSWRQTRTAQHNTPKHEIREVFYPWHPLFGKSVTVQCQLVKWGCRVFRCLVPGQEAAKGCEIPIWMLDRARCAAMQLKAEPRVSWEALLSLQQLWNEALKPAKALRQPAGKSPAGNAYEQETNPSPPNSVRSSFQAATLAGSASANPGPVTAAVDPTLKEPRPSPLRLRQEGRSR